MTKIEFLEQLRKELNGNVSPKIIKENIEYYDSYITSEVNAGQKEEDVLSMIGDPWVIAQTIIGANDGKNQETVYESEEMIFTSEKRNQNRKQQASGKVHVFGLETWWKKLLLILVIVMIIVGIFAIAAGLIRLLAPVAIPVLIVVFIRHMFKGRQS